MIELRSKSIRVQIKQKGAELCSYYNLDTQIEHVWQADPSFWNRHAPILFPIVGQVEDGEYFVDGKRYELSQHGFARDCDFVLEEQNQNSVVFSLSSDAISLAKYPFQFKLWVTYTLLANQLYIMYKVENTGDSSMYFQIGAHPGFTCPFKAEESFSDYKLVFDKALNEDRLLFEDGLLNGKIQKDFMSDASEIKLDSSTFDEDAIIFETDKIESVLITKDGVSGLKVGVKNWPLLGVWSKPKANAPFLCIEPWYGVASVRGESKELKDKKAIQTLEAKQKFECMFTVEAV